MSNSGRNLGRRGKNSAIVRQLLGNFWTASELVGIAWCNCPGTCPQLSANFVFSAINGLYREGNIFSFEQNPTENTNQTPDRNGPKSCFEAVFRPAQPEHRETSRPQRPGSSMARFVSPRHAGATDVRLNPRLETPARKVFFVELTSFLLGRHARSSLNLLSEEALE